MTRQTKLTDLQLVLLSTAAARTDGSLLPPADSVADQLARVRKAIPALMKRGLVEEKEASDPAQTWREEGEQRFAAMITSEGRAAVGGEMSAEPVTAVPSAPEAEPQPGGEPTAGSQAAPPRPTKSAQVLALLRREQGATLAELGAATGGLPHTTRAALTGLRKKGHAIDKGKRGEATCYRVVKAA